VEEEKREEERRGRKEVDFSEIRGETNALCIGHVLLNHQL